MSARSRKHTSKSHVITNKAFISYKHHVSTHFALQLEQALKAYAKRLLARPIRIFRDEKHFAPGIDLPNLIVDALDDSEFLILLASPEAAASAWVRDELDRWCGKLNRTHNLIIILVGGAIATEDETKRIDWSRTTALPTVLRAYLERVPLYVDLRNLACLDKLTLADPDFKKAVNGITARFRDIDPNEMLGEEMLQFARNRRLRNGAAAALIALTLMSILAACIAVRQRDNARHQERLAVSRQYAAEATTLIESNLDAAMLRGARAVTAQQTFEARNSLFQALSYSPQIEAFLYDGDGTRELPAAFTKSGAQIALAAPGGIDLFELPAEGDPIGRSVPVTLPTIASVAYTHSGSSIAVGTVDGRVLILNALQLTPIGTPMPLNAKPVDRLLFDEADDRLFALAGGQGFILRISDRGLSQPAIVNMQDPTLETETDLTHHAAESTATADGHILATGFASRVQIWDLREPFQQRYFFDIPHHAPTVAIRELAISPVGERLAVDLVAGSDGIPVNFVRLYSLGTAAPDEPEATFITRKYLDDDVTRLAFSNNGDRLLIGTLDSTFHMIDLKVLDSYIADNARASPSQPIIGNIDIRDPDKLEDYRRAISTVTVRGLMGAVHGPRFAPDDSKCLLAIGPRIIVWTPHQRSLMSRTLATYDSSSSSIAFSRDGDTLILATADGSIYRWGLHDGGREIRNTSRAETGTTFLTDDGNSLAVVHKDQLSFVDTLEGRNLQQRALDGWTPLAMSTDGTLMVQFRDGILRVVNVASFKEAWRTQLYDERRMKNRPVREPGVSFSQDGTRIVAHVFGTAQLTEWNTASGRQLRVFDAGVERGWDWAPALSPDGTWIATAANSHTLRVVNTITREITNVEAPGSICKAVFSPNSANLAISYEREEEDADDAPDAVYHPADYGVVFWDTATKQKEPPTISLASPPSHLAFSPTGDRLAIATSPEGKEQGEVSIWDVEPALWAKAATTHVMYQPSEAH